MMLRLMRGSPSSLALNSLIATVALSATCSAAHPLSRGCWGHCLPSAAIVWARGVNGAADAAVWWAASAAYAALAWTRHAWA
jgi:hypothetical protein